MLEPLVQAKDDETQYIYFSDLFEFFYFFFAAIFNSIQNTETVQRVIMGEVCVSGLR